MGRVDLPPWVMEVFDTYRTAEVTTLTPGGAPSTFPLSGGWDPELGKFLFTTSVAFAKKVRNARRDPRMALLFSYSVGSPLTAPVILVQGDATVRDDVAANAPAFARMAVRWAGLQPSFAMIWNSRAWRWWCRYYLVRVFIEVAPRRIRAWRDGDTSQAPLEVKL